MSHTLDADERRLKRSLEEHGSGLGTLFEYDDGQDEDVFDTADIEKVSAHWN